MNYACKFPIKLKKKGKISLLVSEWDLCTISLWRKEENKSQQNEHYHKVAQKQ